MPAPAQKSPVWHESPPYGEASQPDREFLRFQTATAALGCGLGLPLRGGFVYHWETIDFNRLFRVGAKSALREACFSMKKYEF